jgi:hypothetical protein
MSWLLNGGDVMKQVAFYEAFKRDPFTGFGPWTGTATLEAIRKAGLLADLAYPYYGDPALGGEDGWACKAPSS